VRTIDAVAAKRTPEHSSSLAIAAKRGELSFNGSRVLYFKTPSSPPMPLAVIGRDKQLALD
jgi:hypothetical protein